MRRDGPSDKTIVRRARQGDRAAFLSLLRRYDPRLRRLALQLLADPRRLDRVLNRAYLKAWRSVPFLKRGESPAKWLYRIVYNTCLNEVRWEPTRQPPPPPEGERIPLPATSAERRLVALRALRYDERIPLVLVDGEGFDVEDAAHMLSRPVDEVADDLARARGRWRAFVMGEPEPPPPPVRTAEPANADNAGSNGHEVWPVTLPNPLLGRKALATLASPTPQREPGGHVKLLTPDDVTLVAQAPPPALLAGLRSAEDLAPLVETPDVRPDAPRRTDAPEPNAADDTPGKATRSSKPARRAKAAKTSKGGGGRNGARRTPTTSTKSGAQARSAAPATPARSATSAPPVPASATPVTPARSAATAAQATSETSATPATPSTNPATPPGPGSATPTGGGAGARRKRRRDAKRAGRARDLGGGSATAPPAAGTGGGPAPRKTGTDGEIA